MTHLIRLFVFALALAPWAVRADQLSLRDVVELHRSGLGEDLLIAVIEADGGPFRLSFADIHDLKSDGISERVIAALVRTGSRPSGAADGSAPVVSVEQHVTTVVPGYVMGGVVAVPGERWRDGNRDGGGRPGDQRRVGSDGRRAPYDHRIEVPPATWVTRPDASRAASPAPIRTTTPPPATWVTPAPGRARSGPDVAPNP